MPQAIIIHGSGGSPEEIWFPWLKAKLEGADYEVFAPAFPHHHEDQTLENWMRVMQSFELSDDCLAIGHSLGVPFILNLLEQRKFKAAYLVGGFYQKLDNHFDEVVHTFIEKPFDWQTIKTNCEHFYVFHSDNDPYVAPEKSIALAEKLGVAPILIPGAGHFNSAAGYFEFEALWKLIEENNR